MPPEDEHKCRIGLDPVNMGRMIQSVENINTTTQEIKQGITTQKVEFNKAIDKIDNKVEKVKKRVGILENWRWYTMGLGVMAIFFIGLAIKLKWIG